MKQSPQSYIKRYTSFLGSRRAFQLILAFFIVESVWIALSGRYPMAFDEDTHLGIIKLFAHHLSPFWSSQPAGADSFGPVVRDPSYLYQWLMSFPYRLISALTDSQTLQVLFLRGINIGIFSAALVLYRDLLLQFRASKAAVHVSLFVFVLIPVVPLLAAQVNYDSLFMLAVAAILLLALRIDQKLIETKRLNVGLLVSLISIGLLGSLIKFAYLPIFVAVLGFLAYRTFQVYPSVPKFLRGLASGVGQLTKRTQLLLLVLFIVSLGLFTERYGVNIVRYHQALPDCDIVLSEQQCEQYGPWARDHRLSLNKATDPTAEKNSPVNFTVDWFYGMWMRSFFSLAGPTVQYQTRGPLILPGISAIVISIVALAAALGNAQKVWRRYDKQTIVLCLGVTFLYIAALWLQEYKAFQHTGHSVAINGRYLFPILPPVILVGVAGLNEIFRRRPQFKTAFLGLSLITLLWGGGAMTYILRSNDDWYWPGNNPVRSVNHFAQKAVGPITPGYNKPDQFLGSN